MINEKNVQKDTETPIITYEFIEGDEPLLILRPPSKSITFNKEINKISLGEIREGYIKEENISGNSNMKNRNFYFTIEEIKDDGTKNIIFNLKDKSIITLDYETNSEFYYIIGLKSNNSKFIFNINCDTDIPITINDLKVILKYYKF